MSKKKKREPLPILSNGYSLVDTHCHLDMKPFKPDLDKVISRAAKAGVTKIITIGIDPASSRKAVELAGQYSGVYASIGIHPHHAGDFSPEIADTFKVLAQNSKVIGYGEIGMDLVKNYSPENVQKKAFEKQIKLATELGLPIIIHDRETHEIIYNTLKERSPLPAGGIIHCYSGDAAWAEKFMELGFFISIPGVVTFKKAEDLREAVRQIPLSCLLVETDGPFLAPEPYRDKRNEPVYVLYTARKVAEIKGITLEEVAEITTANAHKLFKLDHN
ncbi:MAG: TatD family hydrolase [Thermodesulfobacteriota bacterium]